MLNFLGQMASGPPPPGPGAAINSRAASAPMGQQPGFGHYAPPPPPQQQPLLQMPAYETYGGDMQALQRSSSLSVAPGGASVPGAGVPNYGSYVARYNMYDAGSVQVECQYVGVKGIVGCGLGLVEDSPQTETKQPQCISPYPSDHNSTYVNE